MGAIQVKKARKAKPAFGIFSVKGGVGKTLVALNVARYLRDVKGVNVGYIDADLDNSNFSQFTGMSKPIEVGKTGETFTPHDWDGIPVFSMSLLAGRGKSVSMKDFQYAQILKDVVDSGEWNVDYFLVDLPGGSSGIFRSTLAIFAEKYLGDFIVTQPIVTDALKRSLYVHSYLGIPVLGVINNMAWLEYQGRKIYPFGNPNKTLSICKAARVTEVFSLPLLLDVPDHVDRGDPTVFMDYDGVFERMHDVIMATKPRRLSFIQRIVKVISRESVEQLVKMLKKMLEMGLQLAYDNPSTAKKIREYNLDPRRVYLISVTDDNMERSLFHFHVRIAKLKVIKNFKGEPDGKIYFSYRTLARMILGKKKVNGQVFDHDPIDSWLHGEFIAQGDGMTTRVMRFLMSMLTDPEIITPVKEQYGKILAQWI